MQQFSVFQATRNKMPVVINHQKCVWPVYLMAHRPWGS